MVHHAVHVAGLGLDDHMLAEKLLGLHPGQGLNPEKAPAVDVPDNQPDLVQMGHHRHLWPLARAVDDEIMKVIRLKAEPHVRQQGAHQLLRLVLKAGGGHRLTQRPDPGPQVLLQLSAVKFHVNYLLFAL